MLNKKQIFIGFLASLFASSLFSAQQQYPVWLDLEPPAAAKLKRAPAVGFKAKTEFNKNRESKAKRNILGKPTAGKTVPKKPELVEIDVKILKQ